MDHGAALYGSLFRRWLYPFRGVATRYLPNYLVWHRFLTMCDRAGTSDTEANNLLIACTFP